MQEMQIYGVSFDLVGKQPIVLLKTAEGNKFLPIWIGHPEAAAILMKLQSASTPRPMTHDLVTDMLDQLGATVSRITVTELRENTFYAQITVQLDGSEIEVDSRPSDAIALAIRAEAPIFAADEVIEESAIEFEGEEVTEEEIESKVSEFKHFLDQVRPDEFAVEPEDDVASSLRRAGPPLREVEHLLEQLLQPVRRERAAVCALQVLQHPLLALGVEEVDAARLLVALQPRDEPQPRVDRVDDRPVGVGDLLAELLDEWVVVCHGRPSHFSFTGSSLRGSVSSRNGYVTRAWTGSPSDGVRSRTTTTTWSPTSCTRTIRRS